jgi:hypothetical protein
MYQPHPFAYLRNWHENIYTMIKTYSMYVSFFTRDRTHGASKGEVGAWVFSMVGAIARKHMSSNILLGQGGYRAARGYSHFTLKLSTVTMMTEHEKKKQIVPNTRTESRKEHGSNIGCSLVRALNLGKCHAWGNKS